MKSRAMRWNVLPWDKMSYFDFKVRQFNWTHGTTTYMREQRFISSYDVSFHGHSIDQKA